MIIFISARTQDLGRRVRDHLELFGHTVLSSWLDSPRHNRRSEVENGAQIAADLCLQEIDQCDLFVLVVEDDRRQHKGNTHVQMGYAIGKGKQVVILGAPENMMSRCSQVTVLSTANELVNQLQSASGQRNVA